GDGGPLLGTAPLPPAALLLPAAQRVAVVYDPAVAAQDAVRAPAPGTAERQAAVVAAVRARLTRPDATLTERAALAGWDRGTR
ncbi:hypothetical protein DY240_08115, partial [Jiangella rhizosphaerae]